MPLVESEQEMERMELERIEEGDLMSKINHFIELIKSNEADEDSLIKESCTNHYFFTYFFKYYPDGVYYIDLNGDILNYNDSVKTMLGCDDEEIVEHLNQFLHDAFDLSDEKWFTEVIEQPLKKSVKYDQSLDSILIEVVYVQVSIGNKIVGVLGIIHDSTEFKTQDLKIAYYDQLTELPNNRFLKEKLNEMTEQATERGYTFSLLYLDVDRFKYLNDTLGHTIGDRLLQAFSVRVASILSDHDTLARISGDKFAIVIRDISEHSEIGRFADHILQIMKRPFHIEKFELFVSTSIGITTFPRDGENSEKLHSNADAALSLAKELGNNSYQIYDPIMKDDLKNEYRLESDLRRALVQNELFVEFQPRVDAITNEIVSAEALVRWEHPEWGRMMPGSFIPIAEQSGLISDIGEWVLRHVCEQLREWIVDGSHLVVPISVNLSAQTFMRRGWNRTLYFFLEQNHIPPHLIEIEITESAIIKNEKMMSDALKYLNEKEIKVALDDFGTGFSSLSYLKKFEIDTLKIDKSFIQGMQNNEKDIAIIRHVIQLAKELKIRIVAEGVETKQHLEILKELECDEIQGFYFSKPVPNEQFRELLRKRKFRISSEE